MGNLPCHVRDTGLHKSETSGFLRAIEDGRSTPDAVGVVPFGCLLSSSEVVVRSDRRFEARVTSVSTSTCIYLMAHGVGSQGIHTGSNKIVRIMTYR